MVAARVAAMNTGCDMIRGRERWAAARSLGVRLGMSRKLSTSAMSTMSPMRKTYEPMNAPVARRSSPVAAR